MSLLPVHLASIPFPYTYVFFDIGRYSTWESGQSTSVSCLILLWTSAAFLASPGRSRSPNHFCRSVSHSSRPTLPPCAPLQSGQWPPPSSTCFSFAQKHSKNYVSEYLNLQASFQSIMPQYRATFWISRNFIFLKFVCTFHYVQSNSQRLCSTLATKVTVIPWYLAELLPTVPDFTLKPPQARPLSVFPGLFCNSLHSLPSHNCIMLSLPGRVHSTSGSRAPAAPRCSADLRDTSLGPERTREPAED